MCWKERSDGQRKGALGDFVMLRQGQQRGQALALSPFAVQHAPAQVGLDGAIERMGI